MTRKDRLYDRVRSPQSIRKAWAKIYENGQNSDSKETQKLVTQYKQDEEKNLKALSKKLLKRDFNFGTVRGLAIKKKSGKLRPLVSATIEARIVQRAVLDELTRRREVSKYFAVKTSFGAIPKKGVPEAIKGAVEAIKSGAKYYIKSDIADFFTKIPRAEVVKNISSLWNDQDFSNLLESVTNLEIENLKELEQKHGASFKDKFIFDKTGTPQGCCLSPLIGNILLYDFDTQMNDSAITCLRYLDDFIIFGKDYGSVRKAYNKAQKILGKHGLAAYDIDKEKDKSKADKGTVDKPFEYLGVEFRGQLIRPSNASKDRFISAIGEILGSVLDDKDTRQQKPKNIVSALYYASNKIRGWGNQYKFCNDTRLMGSIDAEISQLIIPCFFKFSKHIATLDKVKQRELIGIWSLHDCKSEPIKF